MLCLKHHGSWRRPRNCVTLAIFHVYYVKLCDGKRGLKSCPLAFTDDLEPFCCRSEARRGYIPTSPARHASSQHHYHLHFNRRSGTASHAWMEMISICLPCYVVFSPGSSAASLPRAGVCLGSGRGHVRVVGLRPRWHVKRVRFSSHKMIQVSLAHTVFRSSWAAALAFFSSLTSCSFYLFCQAWCHCRHSAS